MIVLGSLLRSWDCGVLDKYPHTRKVFGRDAIGCLGAWVHASSFVKERRGHGVIYYRQAGSWRDGFGWSAWFMIRHTFGGWRRDDDRTHDNFGVRPVSYTHLRAHET